MDAYKKRFAYYAMDRANIIPACVAYLGCVGMSWSQFVSAQIFGNQIVHRNGKGESFKITTDFRDFIPLQIYIYWDMQKRHVPVFSHKTPAPPGFDGTLIWQAARPVPGGYQTASQRTPRTNGVFPSSNQPVVAACAEFGHVARSFCVGRLGYYLYLIQKIR